MSGKLAPIERCEENTIKNQGPQWFVDYLPITGGNKVELYIDGEEYGEALFDALGAAQDEVLMTGLHFDPDWQLRRSAGSWRDQSGPYSLLNILQIVARHGVNIHLLVNQFWKRESEDLDIVRDSIKEGGHLDWYMPKTVKLYDGLKNFANVRCRTDIHPATIFGTHHQKTVIIDKSVAFVGGIDLTAVDGDRWDNNRHEITASSATEYRKSGLPTPLWHDVHCKIIGPAVKFVLDNFHARWNHGRLFKEPRITKEIESRTYGDWGDGRQGITIEVPVTKLKVTADPKPQLFERISTPSAVYQAVTRHEDKGTNDAWKGINVHTRLLWRNKADHSQTRPYLEANGIEGAMGWELYDPLSGKIPCGEKAIAALDSVRIQVVRSMPHKNFSYKKQKPKWNLSHYEYERATKDAYLTGIRAASKYIYIENQWCSDEAIWEELARAAKRNRDNDQFRIVIMLPRKPLKAAGYGTNQDINQEPLMQEVIAACKYTIQFGVYCLVVPIPGSRQLEEFSLDQDALDEFKGPREWEIYVHSKVMIVDDKWALIGSGNAGGISLEGIREPTVSPPGARPDSELGVIIYDIEFAKKFRGRLFSEHASDAAYASMSFHDAADAWRGQAKRMKNTPSTKFPGKIRFHPTYLAAMSESPRKGSKVHDAVARTVQRTMLLRSTRGFGAVTVQLAKEGSPTTTIFWLEYELPSPAYEVGLAWSLDDEEGNPLALRSAIDDKIMSRKTLTSDHVIYIPSKTRQRLLEQKNMSGLAILTCIAAVVPAGYDLTTIKDASTKYWKENVFSASISIMFDRTATASSARTSTW